MNRTLKLADVDFCPVCEEELEDNAEHGYNTRVCALDMIWFVQMKDAVAVVNDRPMTDQAALDQLHTCPICTGPLGSAGPTVVCDGKGCCIFTVENLPTGRFVVMAGVML